MEYVAAIILAVVAYWFYDESDRRNLVNRKRSKK